MNDRRKRLNQQITSDFEDISKLVSIADVYSELTGYKLRHMRGKTFACKCVFHDDKKMSAMINCDINGFYCLVCGEKYDILGFVRRYIGFDNRGALEWLRERAAASKSEREAKR